METRVLVCHKCGGEMLRYPREVNYGRGVEFREYETCLDCGHARYVDASPSSLTAEGAGPGNSAPEADPFAGYERPAMHWSANKGWGNARPAYWAGDLNDPSMGG